MPAQMSGYRSTETRLLLGDAKLDEMAATRKRDAKIIKKVSAAAQDDDSDSGLEFEDAPQANQSKPSFKDFLAQKKISY